jgi:DNA adenine methylase
MSRPPVPYFGAKQSIAAQIVATFPAHEHYVEPYCGGLSVLLAKGRSKMETVNDLDNGLMTFWRILRDRPCDLARACSLTPHSRAEFLAAQGSHDGLDELEVARRVWVQMAQGRAGIRRRTGWRHHADPAGSGTSLPDILDAYVERITDAAEALAGVSLECRPALDVIERYGRHRGVLLYVDPPYLAEVRTKSSGRYLHEMSDPAAHHDLIDALTACKASVVMSGYDSELYADALPGWHVTRIATTTAQGGSRRERVEVLWSNSTPEASLFEMTGRA